MAQSGLYILIRPVIVGEEGLRFKYFHLCAHCINDLL